MSYPFGITGADVCFLHWPVDTDEVAARVPDGIAVDTYDGSAWVSALPHRITGARLAGRHVPVQPFAQLNVRTYVRRGDERGVYFLDCETADPVGAAIARRGFGVPFVFADATVETSGDRITFRSRRRARTREEQADGARPASGDRRFDVRYHSTGPATEAATGSLAEFLVERKRWYLGGDRLRVGRIEREPWRVGPVSVSLRTDTLTPALGLTLAGDPIAQYSPGYEMAVAAPEPVTREGRA
jgi:hypothetical protein